jgi:hypothetical protein
LEFGRRGGTDIESGLRDIFEKKRGHLDSKKLSKTVTGVFRGMEFSCRLGGRFLRRTESLVAV